jgi:hypothetical protein
MDLKMQKIIRVVSFMFIGILSSQCAANDNKQTTCEKWLAGAIKDIESVPQQARFERALKQIQQACDKAIPEKLKTAAADGLKAKSPQQRFTILMQGATPYFPSICQDIEAGKPASYLLPVCKGNDSEDGDYTAMLPYIEASSYLYGKAIEKELNRVELKAIIRNSRVNTLYLKKFMLNYFLGAQYDYKTRKPNY